MANQAVVRSPRFTDPFKPTKDGVTRAVPDQLPLAALAGDYITSVLQRIRLSTWVAGLSECAGRWSVQIPTGPGGFYGVLEGRLALKCDHGASHYLYPGDLAVITHGENHVIGDDPASPQIPLEQVVTQEAVRTHRGVIIGRGEVNAKFIGGLIALDEATNPHLRAAFPQVMIVRPPPGGVSGLVPTTLRLLEGQARDQSQGTNAVMTNLVTLLFVEAVRAHIESLGATGPAWVRALLDAQIGPALGLIHSAPGRAWTLTQMANEAGLSRTVFFERFTALVGTTPAAYLRDHRMRLASELIRDGGVGIAEIAAKVGYASPGALSGAFKRWSKLTPGQYRVRHAVPSATQC